MYLYHGGGEETERHGEQDTEVKYDTNTVKYDTNTTNPLFLEESIDES